MELAAPLDVTIETFTDRSNTVPLRVAKRRALVSQYMMMQLHPSKMHKILDVSQKTIDEDIKAIKTMGIKWGDDMAAGGFMVDCATQLARMELVIGDMEIAYRKSRVVAQKSKNAASRADFKLGVKLCEMAALKMQMADNIPMYHRYSALAKKYEADSITKA